MNVSPVPWHADLGPAWLELGWAPTPRYLLRRDRVLHHLRTLRLGAVLEIGCGIGAMLHESAALGFHCTALETSTEAFHLAERALELSPAEHIDLCQAARVEWRGRFQTLIALEVLEHIDDDLGALRAWTDWLVPEGTMLISVPAHTRRWGPADEWAGHVRRYERAELEQKLAACGLKIEALECYGFPLGNLLDVFSRRAYQDGIIRRADGTPDRAANNDRSGIDRAGAARAYRLLATMPGRLSLRAAFWLQNRFLTSELGTGFIVTARKT